MTERELVGLWRFKLVKIVSRLCVKQALQQHLQFMRSYSMGHNILVNGMADCGIKNFNKAQCFQQTANKQV